MVHHRATDISNDDRSLGDLAGKIALPAVIVGVIGIVLALLLGITTEGGIDRFFQAWLVNFMFLLAISLGGLFFTLIHHATHAGWSVVVRRVSEALAANLCWIWVAFLPLLWPIVIDHDIVLFEWSDPALAEEALLQHKQPYLNVPFFLIRSAVYFGIWAYLGLFFWRLSVRQDETGDVELTHRMTARSYPSLILFALTLTFAGFDWMMTQDPYWFSTIWGVYFFAGCVGSFLAAAILIFAFLQRTGRLRPATKSTHQSRAVRSRPTRFSGGAVTTEHYHDLGKLLFAFGIVFWAYIAFSQYMLQWYGNLPEETVWWQARASGLERDIHGVLHQEYEPGAWNGWSWFLLVGHFVAPFVAVISRVPKRMLPTLCVAAGWMLFMGWFDIFWLNMANFSPAAAGFAVTDFALLVGLGGLFIALLARRLEMASLIPVQDPRLRESLAFENF